MEHVRAIENKLAAIDASIKHLIDARKGLEKHLFDRVPQGRIDALYNDIALSINTAMQTLEKV